MSHQNLQAISIENDIEDMIGQLDHIQHQGQKVEQYLTPKKCTCSSYNVSPRQNKSLISMLDCLSLYDKLHLKTRISGIQQLQNCHSEQQIKKNSRRILSPQQSITTPTFPNNCK